MKVGFHPVVDSPIRMTYVHGWRNPGDLLLRLAELDRMVSGAQVIPAPWEPFYDECPCCRDAAAYAWARSRLQNPAHFAVDLALFPWENNLSTAPVARAIRLILRSRDDPSRITQQFMIAEALELWEAHHAGWLNQIVETCAAMGIATSANSLQAQLQPIWETLAHAFSHRLDPGSVSNFAPGSDRWHGFDKELLQFNGWSQDPGTIYLPVDGLAHSLTDELLLLNLHRVALLRGNKFVRTAEWEQITLVYLFENAVTFDIRDEPPLIIAGFKQPEAVLKTIQECYRAATERILQSVATQLLKITP